MNPRHSHPEHISEKPGSRATRIFAGVAMCALIVVQAGAEARADASAAATIVGTWDVVVDIINCDTGATIASGGSALGLFNADGTRHETNATNPALRTPGYGNWHHVKNNKFQFAFKFYSSMGQGRISVQRACDITSSCRPTAMAIIPGGLRSFSIRLATCCSSPVRPQRRSVSSDFNDTEGSGNPRPSLPPLVFRFRIGSY
jgi:hypothetical protein